MKSLLVLCAILFSVNVLADDNRAPQEVCNASKIQLATYQYGVGVLPPDINNECFYDLSYAKQVFGLYAKNIDSVLNTIQSLELEAKLDKVKYIKQINELKSDITSTLANGTLSFDQKMGFIMRVGIIGQDLALKSRKMGNELANAQGVAALFNHLLPYLDENDSEFLQRAMGLKTIEECAQLRDLLLSFNLELNAKILEYDLAIAQYKTVENELITLQPLLGI